MYSVLSTNLSIEPFFSLSNSIKLSSSEEPNGSLSRVKSILSLWAPFAFTFVEPAALSKRVVSASGVTSVSVTVKPTL